MNDDDELDTQVAWLRRDVDELKAEVCPYWSDGRHCYAQGIIAPDGDLERRYVHKTCACGATVKPR